MSPLPGVPRDREETLRHIHLVNNDTNKDLPFIEHLLCASHNKLSDFHQKSMRERLLFSAHCSKEIGEW
jgi:hypothetical protein